MALAEDRYRRINDAGSAVVDGDADAARAVVRFASAGRISSARELSDHEADILESVLELLTAGELEFRARPDATFYVVPGRRRA